MTKFEVCKCGHTTGAHNHQGFCMAETQEESCRCKEYEFGFFRESGREDKYIIYYDKNQKEIFRIL